MSEKKHKGGYELLKEKYDKVKRISDEKDKCYAELKEKYDELRLQVDCPSKSWKGLAEARQKTINEQTTTIKEHEETIRKQGTKISTLTADLANAQGEAREYRNKFEEAVRRMGGFRRFIYGYNIPPFTDEDHWHD